MTLACRFYPSWSVLEWSTVWLPHWHAPQLLSASVLHSLHSSCELNRCVYGQYITDCFAIVIEYMNYCVWDVYTCSKLAPEHNEHIPHWKYSCQISKGGSGDKAIIQCCYHQ